MYRRILVPLDGSEQAEAALPTAETLARLASSTLLLVQAVGPEDGGAATAYLSQVADGVRARGLVAEPLVAPGAAADVIAWAATQGHADLIVMATHGRSGPGRWVLGSVADAVLHRSVRPVLLVRPGQPALASGPRRVLVPLDGSELAEQALVHARALAGPAGELLLYQALAPAVPIMSASGEETFWGEMIEDARGETLRYLERTATALRAAGYRVRTAAEFGVPALRIAEYARAEHADLIVISSHGRSGAARWLLGSVADELVRQAPVPLVLLRPLLAAAEPHHGAPRAPALSLDQARRPTTLMLSGRQAQLVEFALDNALREVRGEAEVAAEIHAVLDALRAGVAGHEEARPASGVAASRRVGSASQPRQRTTGRSATATRVDPQLIQPGFPVFAAHANGTNHAGGGQFVGVVQDVLDLEGRHYVHMRGGLGQANEVFLPLTAVRAVVGNQVHLSLSVDDLAGQAWHMPPCPNSSPA